jgi:hypothetical protein
MSNACYIPFLVDGPILSICTGFSQLGKGHNSQQLAAARYDGYIARDVKSAPVSPLIFVTQWDELLQPARLRSGQLKEYRQKPQVFSRHRRVQLNLNCTPKLASSHQIVRVSKDGMFNADHVSRIPRLNCLGSRWTLSLLIDGPRANRYIFT